MELTRGKKDLHKAPPSRLVLHLKAKPTETKEQVHVIKCNRGTHQTLEVYSSVERVMITYGRNLSKELLKKATKPYSPVTDGTAIEMIPKEVASSWCPQ